MQKKVFTLFLCGAFASALYADTVTTYANDPTGNSTDFAGGVASDGGTITTYTFDDLSTGTLNPNAYAGLTLNATGEFTTISNGAVPGQGNTSYTPLSPGEGSHAPSNYLGDNSTPGGSLTVDFSTPVLGAGIFTIDVFNPGGIYDDFSLSAYTGPDGTGTLLGTATGLGYNFQPNNLYFLGVTSDGSDIESVVFTSTTPAGSGDAIGLDNLEVATSSASPAAPEPGTILMGLGASLFGLAAMRRKRTR